jgi:hypothetical protein
MFVTTITVYNLLIITDLLLFVRPPMYLWIGRIDYCVSYEMNNCDILVSKLIPVLVFISFCRVEFSFSLVKFCENFSFSFSLVLRS